MDRQFTLKQESESQFKRVPRKPEKLSNYRRNCSFPKEAHPVSFPNNSSKFLPLSPVYTPQLKLSYVEQCFDSVQYIAEGSYGIVFQARSKDDGKFYAVKKFKQRFKSHMHRRARLSEVQRYGSIPRSPFCVELIRAWEEDAFLFVQMELCSVTLTQYARNHRVIEEETLWKILLDVLLAVKHLHSYEYIHLDIKPDNILVSSNHVFKLGDFGLMLDLSKGPVLDAEEGDSRYLAPEVLNGVYSKAADIFSLGISMLDVASDIQLPCFGELWQDLRSGILPEQHFTCENMEFYDVIRVMMSPNFAVRPSAENVLKLCKLQKLQRKRCVQTILDKMASTLKSLCSLSRVMAINCGLGILKPFASKICRLGWRNESREREDTNDAFHSQPELLGKCTPVQYRSSEERFAKPASDAQYKFRARLASCKKTLDLSNCDEFLISDDTSDGSGPDEITVLDKQKNGAKRLLSTTKKRRLFE